MPAANYSGLHEYYKDKGFRPTFAGFKGEEELGQYEKMRRTLFRDLLLLPPRIFERAKVCEFGPDTGENALIFGRWGGTLTLVEPNPAAWPEIRSYFERYGLTNNLERIDGNTVEAFQSDTRFDFINAEGFIYTVQPTESWVAKLSSLIAPTGFAVVNYLDRSGCLFELLWSLCHSRYQQISDQRGVAAAWSLFEPKWNSISHTRPFESWVKDVLENPFVRLKYLIDPATLLSIGSAQGLTLYSSWPRYEDPFHPFWQKRVPKEAILAERRITFIARSRLSFVFARPLFIVAPEVRLAEINAAILNLVEAIDSLIDRWDDNVLTRAEAAIAELDDAVAGPAIMADPECRSETRAILSALSRTLGLLKAGEPEALRTHLRSDKALMATWGATTHYAVFRRASDDRA